MKKILLMCLLGCMGILAYANPMPPPNPGNDPAVICTFFQDCGNRSQQQQTPRAKNITYPNRYGSVALGTIPGNPISAVGWGTNQKSLSKAQALALKNCQAQGAEGCKLHTDVRNGCIAVMNRYRADGLVTTTAHWGGGITDVKQKVQKKCEASDKKCEIVDVQCSAHEGMKHVWGR